MTGSDATPAADGSFWVFGYGSLMWRPGFTYARRCKGLLRGWRRSLCVYSHVYRGSPERPGLVLGLDRGGACPGVAFEVDPALREATVRYLREREQATAVYLERRLPVSLEGGLRVTALAYVADRTHPQYAGRLAFDDIVRLVRRGEGISGRNPDYVRSTYEHLAGMGVTDPQLQRITAVLDPDGRS